jgi:hypothetical protein
VGVGIGLIALMVTWLVGSRLVELVWEPPVGPVIALSTAVVVASSPRSRSPVDWPSARAAGSGSDAGGGV